MKKTYKILSLVIAGLFSCFVFIAAVFYGGVWMIENFNLPQRSQSVPFPDEDYCKEFNIGMMDSYNVFRWGFDKPDFRIAGAMRLYGYNKDPDHIYAFSTTFLKMLYRGEEGYPDFTVNPIEKVVLSHWNNGKFATNTSGKYSVTMDFLDGEIFEWLTNSGEIHTFADFVKLSENTEMEPVNNLEGYAYIRVVYANSPIYEIVGRLLKTQEKGYYFVPYSRGSADDKFGIPVDISKYSAFPEDFFWHGY